MNSEDLPAGYLDGLQWPPGMRMWQQRVDPLDKTPKRKANWSQCPPPGAGSLSGQTCADCFGRLPLLLHQGQNSPWFRCSFSPPLSSPLSSLSDPCTPPGRVLQSLAHLGCFCLRSCLWLQKAGCPDKPLISLLSPITPGHPGTASICSPRSLSCQVDTADLIINFWYLWIHLLCLLCSSFWKEGSMRIFLSHASVACTGYSSNLFLVFHSQFLFE